MTAPDLVEIDLQQVMAEVAAEEGLSDYGPPMFVEPITRLLDSVQSEGRLNQAGRMGLDMDVRRWLSNRLRLQDTLNRHPEILAEDVSDPIVIVGVPRTGTTKLQRMLARDPGVQSLPFWRILNPAPFPGSEGADPDPRLTVAQGYVEAMSTMAPEVMTLHPFAAEEPEEEVLMLEMTGRSPSAALFFRAPSYTSWLIAQPQQPMFDELKLLMQHLQWQDGGRRGRPWVLKSPMHLGRIGALLDVFPGATVVHCHRDIVTSMTSLSNLIAAARKMRTDDLDPHEVGDFTVGFCALEWERNLAQRAVLGDDPRIVDVDFTQIRDDAFSVINEIYRIRGASLSDEARSAMAGWESTHHARTGDYQCSAEHFGLKPERVRAAFTRYYEAFGSPR